MQLSTKAIVIIVILVLFLIVMLSFLLTRSGAEFSKAEAQRVFDTQCIDYGKRGCDWSVTREPEFQNYTKACKLLFGSDKEALSCLYTFCPSCQPIGDVECEARCSAIRGNTRIGIGSADACEAFKRQCTARCDVCG